MHKQNFNVKKVQGWFRLFCSNDEISRSKWELGQALTVHIWLQNQAWTASHKRKPASYDKSSIKHDLKKVQWYNYEEPLKKKKQIQWNMFAWGLNAPWTLITDTADSHQPTSPHLNFEEKVYAHFINCHPLRTKMAPRYDLRDADDVFHPWMANANCITSIHWNFWRKLHF